MHGCVNRVARHKTAVEFAVDEIKKRIVNQELAPGMRIDQTVLAETLGVSRIPVRQALAKLSDRGFVELYAHRSAVVAPLSITDMEHLYSLRQKLELWAVSDIVKLANQSLLETLKNINQELRTQALAGDLTRYMALNREFHFEILDIVPNPHLRRMLESLFDLTERYQWMCMNADSNLECSLHDHVEIMVALKNNDERQLSEVVLKHSKKTADWFRANISTR